MLQNKLETDGYIILRDFFNVGRLSQLYNNAKFIFDIQFKHFGYDIYSPTNLGYHNLQENMIRLFNEHPNVFINCGKLIQTGLPQLYQLAFDPELLGYLEELGIVYPNVCTRPVLYFNHPKLAKSKEYYMTPKHQDWPSMEASLNSLVVWVPLVDVNKENGSIIIYPGSHKNGVLQNKINGGFAEVDYEGESIQPTMKVGDIAIFSTLLVHESGPILNDTIRWSCHFRYTDMLAPDFIKAGYPSPYSYIPNTKK